MKKLLEIGAFIFCLFSILVVLILFFFSCEARADDWFCTQTASERRGSDFVVCGIAESYSEDAARYIALHNAMHEFNAICDMSEDCKHRKTIVEPRRTECHKVGDKYKCTRELFIAIGPDKDSRSFCQIMLGTNAGACK